MCFVPPPPRASLQAQTLAHDVSRWPSWASQTPVPLGGAWPARGPRRVRAARGHGAISIRARERVAAAPGILLKAFSLFPAICFAPPGPGHVDNLFVEGKGGEEHRREEEMSLFTQPAFCSMGPTVGQLEWGVHHPFPVQEVGGGARLWEGTAGLARGPGQALGR